MAPWGAGGGGGSAGGGGGSRQSPLLFAVPRGGGGGGGSSGLGLIAPPLAPGLPPRVSTQATVVLIVLGFLLGRFTATTTTTAPASSPTTAPSAAATAALPLPTLPDNIRAIAAPEARHAALAAAVTRGELNATALLPDMGPLAKSWLRESGFLALRPPVEPASSGSSDLFMQPLQILSWYPRIVLLPNFIDAGRRARVLALAERRLQQSSLAWRPNEKPDPNQKARTSKGTFLSRHDDPSGVIAQLEEKIAAVTLLPVSHGEAFNVLKYDEGAHYASHHDTFDPKEFGAQASQRMATVLVYLTDVEAGGETIFKKEGLHGDLKSVTDWDDCADGFKYSPRAGDAVLFFSLTPDGAIDPRSLHGGCPVVGRRPKYVATKWLHDKPIGGIASTLERERRRRRRRRR